MEVDNTDGFVEVDLQVITKGIGISENIWHDVICRG